MKFEPETFFIGVIDFFSVIMPGAALAYAIREMGHVQVPSSGETEAWAIFLFVSFLLGHFIFLLGASLDDLVYDKILKGTIPQLRWQLEEGERPPGRTIRILARIFFPKFDNSALELVK